MEKLEKVPLFVRFIVLFLDWRAADRCLRTPRASAQAGVRFDKVPSVFDDLGWRHAGPGAQTSLFNGRTTVAKANNQGWDMNHTRMSHCFWQSFPEGALGLHMQTKEKKEKVASCLFPHLCTRSRLQKLQKPWDGVWKGQERVQSFHRLTIGFNTAVIYSAELRESSREMRRPPAEMSQLAESRQACLQGSKGRCVSGSTAWSHGYAGRIQAKSACLFSPNPKRRRADNQAETQNR